MGIDLGDEGLNGSPKSETEESGEEVDLDYQKSESQPPLIEEIEDMIDELNGRPQPENAEPEVETMDALDEALKDLDELNLADRVNLYFKIGHFVNIDFDIEEN